MIVAAGPGTEENLSLAEIGRRCEVPYRTLHKWKATPEFQEWMRECGSDHSVEQVRDMLLSHALTKGSERHAKLFLDKFGPQNTEKESRFETIFNLSDEELEQIRQSIYRHYEELMETDPAPYLA